MAPRVKKPWPALKHGIFSAIAVLPGEDRAAFQKLHKELIGELAPSGALENDIVTNLARLIWRRRNLGTFRIAELANEHDYRIRRERIPEPSKWTFPMDAVPVFRKGADRAELEAAEEDAENQSRRELGDTYELVEHGGLVTLEQLSSELDMHERLDSMIDRCLKRLLFVRGLKSLSGSSSTASSSRPQALTPGTR